MVNENNNNNTIAKNNDLTLVLRIEFGSIPYNVLVVIINELAPLDINRNDIINVTLLAKLNASLWIKLVTADITASGITESNVDTIISSENDEAIKIINVNIGIIEKTIKNAKLPGKMRTSGFFNTS